ncbi:MAG: nuclear transport factor 2 family protein [Syntrophales bacterium]|jgi:ketosteroid isomerase-like protein|nr:nuclear transport factor 2 family protein [Syntrophales bacterium]
MNNEEKRALIERYLQAYNTVDIDGMLALLHPNIRFRSIAGGEITAETSGIMALRHLAEHSRDLFSFRKQILKRIALHDNRALIEVAFEGILADDLPNGMHKGETLRLTGRSEFTFHDGKINRITDIS